MEGTPGQIGARECYCSDMITLPGLMESEVCLFCMQSQGEGVSDDGAAAPKQDKEMQRVDDTLDSNNGVPDHDILSGDFQLGNAHTPLKAIGET